MEDRRNRVDRVPHTRGDEPIYDVAHGIGDRRVPHTRGDEPLNSSVDGGLVRVFPTRVGMNRSTGT